MSEECSVLRGSTRTRRLTPRTPRRVRCAASPPSRSSPSSSSSSPPPRPSTRSLRSGRRSCLGATLPPHWTLPQETLHLLLLLLARNLRLPSLPPRCASRRSPPPTFYFQPPEGALENRGGRDRAFDDQYQPPYDSYDDDDDYEGDAAHSTLQTAPPHVAVATNSFLRADRVYDKYAGVANPMETMYVRQGKVGARLQDATWLLAEPFADKPTAIDDYLRCSTLLRSCTPGEVLRRCTYEPRGAWYRELRSRTNAPLDWPYCEPDLVKVYFNSHMGN